MKIYKIKLDDVFYVKAIVFGSSKDEELFQMIATPFEIEAGWYEEDKAKIYCEELNKNKEYKEVGLKFSLEEVVKRK